MQSRLILKSLRESPQKVSSYILSGFFTTKRFITTAPSIESPQKHGENRFFDAIREHKSPIFIHETVPSFFASEPTLKKILYSIDPSLQENYLMDHFVYWLSKYAAESRTHLKRYFDKEGSLTAVSQDFIHFCFQHNISLDPDKTLQAFDYHNRLSDLAVKKELMTVKPKQIINILGFGLDEGQYEKSLSQFLIDRGIAKTVNIYGFDPYALKTKGIQYLTDEQLASEETPRFDFIIARWVLHHVALKERWKKLIHCINHSKQGSMALIVEHGFLNNRCFVLDEKIYHLFNAIFDIVANIGLRPRYFTDSAPNIGSNFFIHYLTHEDFAEIRKNIPIYTVQNIVDIGPGFPNQTICSMRL